MMIAPSYGQTGIPSCGSAAARRC